MTYPSPWNDSKYPWKEPRTVRTHWLCSVSRQVSVIMFRMSGWWHSSGGGGGELGRLMGFIPGTEVEVLSLCRCFSVTKLSILREMAFHLEGEDTDVLKDAHFTLSHWSWEMGVRSWEACISWQGEGLWKGEGARNCSAKVFLLQFPAFWWTGSGWARPTERERRITKAHFNRCTADLGCVCIYQATLGFIHS